MPHTRMKPLSIQRPIAGKSRSPEQLLDFRLLRAHHPIMVIHATLIAEDLIIPRSH